MKQFKFYCKLDDKKEAIKTFKAPNLNMAYQIASEFKQIHISEFKQLFKVEEIK